MEQKAYSEKVKIDLGCSQDRAEWICGQLTGAAPVLEQSIQNWYSGEPKDFHAHGLSLYSIMKKDHCTYLQAILRMDLLLKNEQLRSFYLQNDYFFE